MADERWTAETEELVARALPGIPSVCPDPQCGDSTWDHDCELGGERPDTASARKVLTTLADAGALTAVGGETRQEWRVVRGESTAMVWGVAMTPDFDAADARGNVAACRAIWPDAQLQTRMVHVDSWREVTDDPA